MFIHDNQYIACPQGAVASVLPVAEIYSLVMGFRPDVV
jgi:hypothetical protein